MNSNEKNISSINFTNLIIGLGVTIITWAALQGTFSIIGIVSFIPLALLLLLLIIKKPDSLLIILFITNYFIIGISRYVKIPNISVFMDAIIFGCLLLALIHYILFEKYKWDWVKNTMVITGIIWMGYCIVEMANPTSMLKAWVTSRGVAYYVAIVSIITALLCNKYKTVRLIIFLFAIFSFMAASKAIIQKFIGFDFAERRWLNQGGALTHLIGSGTRYFSFFTDAGNMGSNMGASGVMLVICALYVKNINLKLFYSITGLLSFYAMLLSGTRGAMIVPLGGIGAYVVFSKNIKAIVAGSLGLIFIYIFFAFTTIGQGNQQIRRMRTAFQPDKDASFNARKINQAKLAVYLKNKPFGEGLGLSGVENKKNSIRFTTSIPHDSWYVKIWVETGVVGITLYLAMIFGTIAHCGWILMFKIKNKELKGLLTGWLCATSGLILSAYGNAFWGQYPTYIFAIMGLTICQMAERFDNEIAEKNINTNKILEL